MKKLIKVVPLFNTKYWNHITKLYDVVSKAVKYMITDSNEVLKLDIETTREHYNEDNTGHCVYDKESQGYTAANEFTHLILDEELLGYPLEQVDDLEDLCELIIDK